MYFAYEVCDIALTIIFACSNFTSKIRIYFVEWISCQNLYILRMSDLFYFQLSLIVFLIKVCIDSFRQVLFHLPPVIFFAQKLKSLPIYFTTVFFFSLYFKISTDLSIFFIAYCRKRSRTCNRHFIPKCLLLLY